MSVLSGGKPSRKRAGDQRVRFPFGPFRRVIRSAALSREFKDALLAANNTYFVDSEQGSGVARRPPWVQKSVGGILGTVGGRAGQCAFEHVRVDGTIDRVVFIGGKMYAWNGGTTFVDITPGAVTISTTARIFCCTFNDELIVSDGVNRPWRYNPATATATYIQVDSASTAWCAFGQPVVHGGALFFVLNTVGGVSFRNKIVWSETLAADLGYMQTGYVDFWTVSQTDTRAIYALVSTETALYLFRARSITTIRGTVDRSFTSNANVEALPFGIGTTTPVLLFSDYIWFYDEMGRAYRLPTAGGRPEALWRQSEDSGLSYTTNVFDAAISYAPDLRLVVMGVWDTTGSTTTATAFAVYHADTGIYNGDWTLVATYGVSAFGVCRDDAGFLSLVALGTDGASFGAVYRLRNAINELGSSASDPGTGTPCAIYLHALPPDSVAHYNFHTVTLRVIPAFSAAAALRTYTLTIDGPATGVGSSLGSATAPVGRLLLAPPGTTSIGDASLTWGFAKTDRWAQLAISVASTAGSGTLDGPSGQPFYVLDGEVWATPIGYSPRSR